MAATGNAATGAGTPSDPNDDAPLQSLKTLLPQLTAEDLEKFHQKDDLDVRDESHHHSLGVGPTQAAKGSHTHMGGNGLPILTGQTITGSKGGNTALASVIAILVAMGATDAST